RVKLAYDLLVHGKGEPFSKAEDGIESSYQNNVTDEFIKPISIVNDGKPVAVIEDGDAVICFNFRTDRCREITMALTQQNFPEQDMHTLNLHYVDRKSTRLNSSHVKISYAVFCLKKKN